MNPKLKTWPNYFYKNKIHRLWSTYGFNVMFMPILQFEEKFQEQLSVMPGRTWFLSPMEKLKNVK